MASSSQADKKRVLILLGPLSGYFKGKLGLLLDWALRRGRSASLPPLLQVSDELILLYVGVYPKEIASGTDFESGVQLKKMEAWHLAGEPRQQQYKRTEEDRAMRTLETWCRPLCEGQVNHVAIRMEWAGDVHSKAAEMANAIGTDDIVLGTDDTETATQKLKNLLGRNTSVHVPKMGSELAALVHCNVYCISLTSGQLVTRLKGEASLPRPGSGPSSGLSIQSHPDEELQQGGRAAWGQQASHSPPAGAWQQNDPTAHEHYHSGSSSFRNVPLNHFGQHAALNPPPAPGFGDPTPPGPSNPVLGTSLGRYNGLMHSGRNQFSCNSEHEASHNHLPRLGGSAPGAGSTFLMSGSSGHTGRNGQPEPFADDEHMVSKGANGYPPYPEASAPPLSWAIDGAAGPSVTTSAYRPSGEGYGQANLAGRMRPQMLYEGRADLGRDSRGVQYTHDSVPPHTGGNMREPPIGAPPRSRNADFMDVDQHGGSPDGKWTRQQRMPSTARQGTRPREAEWNNRQQLTESENMLLGLASAPQEQPAPAYEVYTLEELTAATEGFSHELGGGGFGTVYLGNLRGTPVAVKRMNAEGDQGPAQFECEVKTLTALRHRNIVILMGCCPEAFCLVYEYCAQGSLEKRLADEASPLPWYKRVRIIYDIATPLLWMHKRNVIHCDIKLANVLLDENNTAKLADVGISRVVPAARADPRTAALTGALTGLQNSSSVQGSVGYVDPALFRGYPVSESSDVYALGVCFLQLLTRRSADVVVRDVEQAHDSNGVNGVGEILDVSAGDWPLNAVVEELTNLGLWCTQPKQKERPQLETEVIPTLVRLSDLGKAAEREEAERLRRMDEEMATHRNHRDIMESQFCCPITHDIMEDPVVAVDGHTYERREIEKWLANNAMSPNTGVPLHSKVLIPNQAVKSAILEWKERMRGQVGEE